MKFQITPMFATPMVEVQHPNCERLNTDLRNLFLAREAEGARYANPHPTMQVGAGLFESNFDLFSWPESSVQALREFCWTALSRAIAEINGYGPERMNRIQIYSHTWFHITRPGGQFGVHNHPMASWSGVYCVDPGDSDPADGESGALAFVNPCSLAYMFSDPANANLRRPYNQGNLRYNSVPGRLVLFPSWVQHNVQAYRGRRERITVAFNCWFSETPPA